MSPWIRDNKFLSPEEKTLPDLSPFAQVTRILGCSYPSSSKSYHLALIPPHFGISCCLFQLLKFTPVFLGQAWLSPFVKPSLSPQSRADCHYIMTGLPWWLRWWRICSQCRRSRFNSWIGKIPRRRAWQLTPVYLPGEFHGQRNLVGYRSWGCRRVAHDWVTNTSTFFHFSWLPSPILHHCSVLTITLM